MRMYGWCCMESHNPKKLGDRYAASLCRSTNACTLLSVTDDSIH